MACIFIHFLSAQQQRANVTSLSYWNSDGANHVIVVLDNCTRENCVSEFPEVMGRAIVARQSFRAKQLRKGFDIVLPVSEVGLHTFETALIVLLLLHPRSFQRALLHTLLPETATGIHTATLFAAGSPQVSIELLRLIRRAVRRRKFAEIFADVPLRQIYRGTAQPIQRQRRPCCDQNKLYRGERYKLRRRLDPSSFYLKYRISLYYTL